MQPAQVRRERLAQLRDAEVVRVERLARRDRVDAGLADELAASARRVAHPERQDVRAAEAGVEQLADLRGAERAYGSARGGAWVFGLHAAILWRGAGTVTRTGPPYNVRPLPAMALPAFPAVALRRPRADDGVGRQLRRHQGGTGGPGRRAVPVPALSSDAALRLRAPRRGVPAPSRQVLAAPRGPAALRRRGAHRPHGARRHRHVGHRSFDALLVVAGADLEPALYAAHPGAPRRRAPAPAAGDGTLLAFAGIVVFLSDKFAAGSRAPAWATWC